MKREALMVRPTPEARADALLRQAIAWTVRLQSGHADARSAQACLRWRCADPAHEQAWQQVIQLQTALERDFSALAPSGFQAARSVLEVAAVQPARRKTLQSLAGVLGLAMPSGWLAWQHMVVAEDAADYATSVGERREMVLADASRLLLNTHTSVRQRFGVSERLLWLDRGELLLRTGTDPGRDMPRPLSVQTAHGRFDALGTRFRLRLTPTESRLVVEQGAVRMQPRHGGTPRVAMPGESLWMTPSAITPATDTGMDSGAWTTGLLVVRDMRLLDFLAELDRYRFGYLGCDEQAAALRISGTYRLDDPEQVLSMLATVLPVRIERRSRYWVRLRHTG